MRGAAKEAELFYAIGSKLANSSLWPSWNQRSEFAKVRAQSHDARPGEDIVVAPLGERG